MEPLPPIQQRMRDNAESIAEKAPWNLTYQHTVFCQTSLPYRNPGASVRRWHVEQGGAHLRVEAGSVIDPATNQWVPLGLPFGPKPRLILCHLNREALLHGQSVVAVEGSLTAFIKRILGYSPNGYEVRQFKSQLAALSAAMIRLAMVRESRLLQVNTYVVGAFDLWLPKDERQRVLWPEIVRLSPDYFDSLQRHAVPLDERAVGALAHSSLALDIYCWLAQRLHRIKRGHTTRLSWAALKDQFGSGYTQMNHFRRVFREALTVVASQYPGARLELDRRGMKLRHSAPPVLCRYSVVRQPE